MKNSLAELKTIAHREEARIVAAENQKQWMRDHRGQCPMYYFLFGQYFAWVIAKIPFIQRHDTFELHFSNFGAPLSLHEVEDFLKRLTGEKFEALFCFKAGRAQYQYLDDMIVEALRKQGIQDLLGDEAEKAGIEPLNVKRAREWLNEQIELARRGPIEVATAEPEKADNKTGEAAPITPPLAADLLPEEDRLSMRQLALLQYYKGLTWQTTQEAAEAARIHGHDSPTSGRQLKEHYNWIHQKSNRTGVDGKAIADMCRDIAAVIPYLPDGKRQVAEKELEDLEDKK